MLKTVSRTFIVYRMDDPEKDAVAVVSVSATDITGAEQNIVLLGDDLKAVAVVELQPGFDRREI